MANEQQQARQIHPAEAACEFMQRADLKGGEVEVFAQTFNWLQAVLKEELVVLSKQDHEVMQAEIKEFHDLQAAKPDEDEEPPQEEYPVDDEVPEEEEQALAGDPA